MVKPMIETRASRICQTKKRRPGPLAPHPALSNAALPGHNAVEEHESHDAVHVDEQNEQHEPGDDEHGDQRSGERGIDGRQRALQKALRTIRMWHPEAARIAAAPAARAHFTGQQTDQRQFGPLPGPEGPQQLLPGMLKSRSNRIHGGNRQIAPQKIAVRSKVLRSGSWVNGILGTQQIADLRLQISDLKSHTPNAK